MFTLEFKFQEPLFSFFALKATNCSVVVLVNLLVLLKLLFRRVCSFAISWFIYSLTRAFLKQQNQQQKASVRISCTFTRFEERAVIFREQDCNIKRKKKRWMMKNFLKSSFPQLCAQLFRYTLSVDVVYIYDVSKACTLGPSSSRAPTWERQRGILIFPHTYIAVL